MRDTYREMSVVQLFNLSTELTDLHKWGIPNAYDSEFEYIEFLVKQVYEYLKFSNSSDNGHSFRSDIRYVFEIASIY